MEHHLLIIDEGKERRIIKLTEVAYSIGRDATNAIVLCDPSTSRQHAMLVRVPLAQQGHRYRIIDGNSQGKPSANGVYINGKRGSIHELRTKDVVYFGKGVKATYLTLEMGQVEFLNYIESLSYQSLKSDVIDTKATVAGSNVPMAELTEVLTAKSKSTAQNYQTPLQQHTQRAKETVRLSREEILKELNKPVSRQIWLVVTGAVLTLVGLTGWLVLNERSGNSTLEFARGANRFTEI
ncbi:FHA domain-containing protein [Acaryochloris sp. CCMEE 5410]|uniref:FHA domain-containing protein n=1 Tax=Acaryochloris sp. CCMEE 5410 TaxID=310037 RepID=UPI0021CFC507|nr:FHA domain-containing protein [Acaryochloris sp. CCMEE 5410]